MPISIKQEEILAEITEKLREHFDTGIIIIETEANEKVDYSTYRTCGSISACIGLMEMKKHDLLNERDL